MKLIFKTVFLLLCVNSVMAQAVPAGTPTVNAPGSWYKIGWVQGQNGLIFAVRDTNFLPSQPGTSVMWQRPGIDTTLWIWTGQRPWQRILKSGDELYVFSTGLTEVNKIVTVNLSTGVLGGQSVVGGVNISDTLRIKSNVVGAGQIRFGNSFYDENTNHLNLNSAPNSVYALNIFPDTSVAGTGNAIAVRRGAAGQTTSITFRNQNNADRIRIRYDMNDNLGFLMDGQSTPHVTIYRQGEVKIGAANTVMDSTRKLSVLDTKASQNVDRIVGEFISNANFNTASSSKLSQGVRIVNTPSKTSASFPLTTYGLYVSANRGDSNYAAIFDSGYIKMNTLPTGLSTDSAVVVDVNGILKKGAPPSEGGGGVNNTNVGSGFRLLNDPSAQTLRTLFSDITGAWDSVSNTGGLTYKLDTSVISTLRSLRDSVLLLLNNMPLVSRIEFTSAVSANAYQNDTLIGKNILSLEVQGYSMGFVPRNNSAYISSFDPNTGTITLTNGVFDVGDFVRVLYRTNPIYLLDMNGWPIKDMNGNYIILN